MDTDEDAGRRGPELSCFSHPHSGTGLAIAGFAVVLAILIGLTGAIAQWVLDARPDKARG